MQPWSFGADGLRRDASPNDDGAPTSSASPARAQVTPPVRPRRAGVLGAVEGDRGCPDRVRCQGGRARRAPRRVPHLPGQPALRRPGRLHPAPDPRAGRARPQRRGVRRAAVARARRGRGVHARPRARPVPRPRPLPDPRATRVHLARRRRRVRDDAERRGSASRSRSRGGSGQAPAARRGEFDIVHDNQCLGSGILELHRAGLAAARDAPPPDHRRPLDRARPRRDAPGSASRRGGGSGSCACRCAWRASCPPCSRSRRTRASTSTRQMRVAARAAHRRAGGRRPRGLPPRRTRREAPRPAHGHLVVATCP